MPARRRRRWVQKPDGEVNEQAPSCPLASKVGTDEIATPLLPNKLKGNVYILQPNPPNLQLLVTASGEGVNLKLVGNVHLNETTGQLTTTFEKTPDVPFTDFKLSFSGGAQAALATPTTCGTLRIDGGLHAVEHPVHRRRRSKPAASRSRPAPTGSACASPLPFSADDDGGCDDRPGGWLHRLLAVVAAW